MDNLPIFWILVGASVILTLVIRLTLRFSGQWRFLKHSWTWKDELWDTALWFAIIGSFFLGLFFLYSYLIL